MSKTKKGISLVFGLAVVLMLSAVGNASINKLRVTVNKANIRSKPELGSTVVGSVSLGAILESEEQVGEWFKVSLPPNEKGFVVTGYIHNSVVEVITAPPVAPIRETTPPVPAPQPAYQPSAGGGIGFSVKLHGGLGYIFGGDVNKGLEGWNAYWHDLESLGVANLDGELKPIHMGMDLGGELIVNITPQIGLGVGVGYLAVGKESNLTWSSPGWQEEETFTVKGKAIPITFNIYYGLPLGNNMNLSLNAGTGLYLGSFSWNMKEEEPGWGWYKEDWKAKSNAFGFHGGVSLEINFTHNIAFVIEGLGRYAKLGKLSGDYTWESEDPGGSDSGDLKDVTLWVVDEDYSPTLHEYTFLYFSDKKPSWPGLSNVREAKLNLSGFSFRAGVKIRIR